MSLNFDNTEIAYSYLSDKELKKAHLIFSMLNNTFISSAGKAITQVAFDIGLPIKGLVKSTIFDIFVGGETISESEPEIQMLEKYGIGTILDYGAEAKSTEEEFDEIEQTFIQVLEKVGAHNSERMKISAKLTAVAKFETLDKISNNVPLTAEEEQQWQRAKERIDNICAEAHKRNVILYVDAEESWIQQAVDDVMEEMMAKYNKDAPIIYTTIQLYRHDRLEFLKQAYKKAKEGNYYLGVKLVRGAYMEKERERALKMGYPSPIQDTKVDSDKDYNSAVEFCIEHIDEIGTCVATHNEESNYYLDEILKDKNISKSHKHLNTAQLFGMGDYITFNMAKDGYNAEKYLPYGPVKDLLPYLLRRANENSSVDGQASRELTLLKKELKRREL